MVVAEFGLTVCEQTNKGAVDIAKAEEAEVVDADFVSSTAPCGLSARARCPREPAGHRRYFS